MKKVLSNILILLLITGIIAGLILIFSGCTVTKGKREVQTQSAQLNKKDSGTVNKNTASEKNNSDWERQILLFNKKDTTIEKNNYITIPGHNNAIDYGAIAAIINEKGSTSKETNNTNYDSSWKQRFDSLQESIHEVSKEKKEQVLSVWQIIAISAGVCGVFFLIGKLKISLK